MLSSVHICPGTECHKKSPTDAGSERKVSLTKGDDKVASVAGRSLEERGGQRRGGRGQPLGPAARRRSPFLSGSIAPKPCTEKHKYLTSYSLWARDPGRLPWVLLPQGWGSGLS